jgi:hypothetical protein
MASSIDLFSGAALVLALTCAACSSEEGGGSSGSSGTGASGGSGGSAGSFAGSSGNSGTGGGGGSAGSGGSSGSGPKCTGPGFEGTAHKQLVTSLTAKVLDLSGAAVNEGIQICGFDICLNVNANASGDVSESPGQELDRPAFKWGNGTRYAKFAFLLPNQPTHAVGTVRTAAFPPTSQGTALSAGSSATSNDLTLTIAAGARVDVDLLTFPDAENQKFRAVEIPMAQASAAVDPALNLELLWATTPVETLFCPAAKLSVPNSKAWPAGTKVEFYLHGVSILELDWAPYGGWAKVSDGQVSADGSRVETADGAGVPMLSVFGIRRVN